VVNSGDSLDRGDIRHEFLDDTSREIVTFFCLTQVIRSPFDRSPSERDPSLDCVISNQYLRSTQRHDLTLTFSLGPLDLGDLVAYPGHPGLSLFHIATLENRSA
jgi:hypothetical protein